MVNDQIERMLEEVTDKLTAAWRDSACFCGACPVGELAAMMAATLTYYRESRRIGPPSPGAAGAGSQPKPDV